MNPGHRSPIPKSHQSQSNKSLGKRSWPPAHSQPQPQLFFPGKNSPTGSPTISCFCGKLIPIPPAPDPAPGNAAGDAPGGLWAGCQRVPRLPAWEIPASARSSCHGTGNAAAQGTSVRGHPFPWPGWHSPCHRAPRAAGSALGHMRTHIPRSTNIPSGAMTRDCHMAAPSNAQTLLSSPKGDL